MALCRAVLTDAEVLDDPLAGTMLHTPQRVAASALERWPLARLARSPTFTFLAARTLFFDHAVNGALDDGARQVVILGAGYDSRSWRLGRAGVRFFEIDHPATQQDKRRRAPVGGPTFVAADLTTERLVELLPASGFTTSERAVFVVEGLTMYLPEKDVHTMLADLAALSPARSRLAVNFTVRGGGSVAPASRAIAWLIRSTWALLGEPAHGWVRPEALASFLEGAGWKTTEMIPAPDLARRYLAGSALTDYALNPGAICIAAERI